jgi:YebC/PmpR family DNA-binding regulatory protein
MGRAFEYRKAAKEQRWGKMSRLFPRLAKAITMAAKEGGDDSSTNSTLRTAINNAKAQNMPKDNIERAVKRASGSDAASYIEINYEGKGPHGVLIFVECATDNTTRTVANVKSYFNKASGQVVPNGSLEFMFSRKAVFEITTPEDFDEEEMELDLIDSGLESIEADEDSVYIYGEYTQFGTLSTAMEEHNFDVKNASLKRYPTTDVEFDDEQTADIEKLLDKLDDDDDVQAVFTNMA